MDITQLLEIFEKFGSECSVSIAGAPAKQTVAQNETNFLNFWACVSSKHSQVTRKDLQDAFNEARFKKDSFINFDQFQDALQLISRICYPHHDPDVGFFLLVQDVTSQSESAGIAQKRRVAVPTVSTKGAYATKSKPSPKRASMQKSPLKSTMAPKISKKSIKA